MHGTGSEIESFVWKFNQLWNCGYEAHMDLNACGGYAWVGLRLNLGQHPNMNYVTSTKTFSPARNKRKMKREAERESNATKNIDHSTLLSTATVMTSENAVYEESSAHISFTQEEVMIDNNVQNANSHQDSEADMIAEMSDGEQSELIDFNGSSAEQVDQPSEGDSSTPKLEIVATKTENILSSNDIIGTESLLTEEQTSQENGSVNENVNVVDKPAQSVIAPVFATAIIKGSPFSTFATEELDSLVRFLTDKEHLKRNILNIEYGLTSSRECSDKSYQHVVSLKLTVSTASLWESPRSYLWKHIGQNTWTRGNGSEINVIKIHQKS